MILILQALSWADCADWDGIFSDTHPIVTQTKSVTLRFDEIMELSLGEPECVDASSCAWSLSTEIGSLESETGASNQYIAPGIVEDCANAFSIATVSCSDDFQDSVEITISCGELDPDNPTFWEPSGGGCNSPTYAYLLLFPFLSLFRKRPRTA